METLPLSLASSVRRIARRHVPQVQSAAQGRQEHRYWSLVESRRCADGRVVQRPVLYLGEINDSQREAWIRSIEAFDEEAHCQRRLTLFPADRELPVDRADAVRVRLSEFELRRPRQWGACWLFCQLWEQLGLREFWSGKLGLSREGTDWEHVLEVLSAYRLIDPGSEWRLHRHWYEQSAMGDLLGEGAGVAQKDTLYRCLDQLLEHKRALFDHLTRRWRDLFGVRFEVLLYDLTSTYFEIDPPQSEDDKRRYGYSRDKRCDCVQVVIALIVTPEGFRSPTRYCRGTPRTARRYADSWSASSSSTARPNVCGSWTAAFPPRRRSRACARATRRSATSSAHPGRLSKLENELLLKPWHEARPGVEVKLLPQEGEMYVFAQSHERIAKERGMRKRQFKRLWSRLKRLSQMKLTREQLLMKLGAAKEKTPPPGGWSMCASTSRRRRSLTACARRSSAKCASAKAVTCCEPISPPRTPRNSGATTSSSCRSKKPSRISRATWRSGPCSTRTRIASRRTSSSASLPTACTSPCATGCASMRLG